MHMELNLHHDSFNGDGACAQIFESVKGEAQELEAAGFDSNWVMDHVTQNSNGSCLVRN